MSYKHSVTAKYSFKMVASKVNFWASLETYSSAVILEAIVTSDQASLFFFLRREGTPDTIT